MNIVFIGMPASGKSTLAKYVADCMNMQFIDTDSEILKKYGDIEALFKSGGETFFREIEKQELLFESTLDNVVIATGGGAVHSDEAMRALIKNSLVVYLQCDIDLIEKRILSDNTKRPLLESTNNEDLRQKLENLQKKREKLYVKYSQITLDVSGILASRNLLQSELSDQLGALQFELFLALEKRVRKKF